MLTDYGDNMHCQFFEILRSLLDSPPGAQVHYLYNCFPRSFSTLFSPHNMGVSIFEFCKMMYSLRLAYGGMEGVVIFSMNIPLHFNSFR